jgi:hypothetical protein
MLHLRLPADAETEDAGAISHQLRQLHSMFGALYLDEITCPRLADYASYRMKAGAQGATIRRDLATLSCLCSCAVSWDYVDVNPVRQFSKRHI